MEEGLLDIAKAAHFLGVSATSLRRWTKAGRIACVRVGGRRERRFRLADLVAFLEEQPAELSVDAPPLSPLGHVSVGDMSLPYGTHLCGFYSSDEGRVKLSASFLSGGIGTGSVGFLLTEPTAQPEILAQLDTDQAAIRRAVAAGRLVVAEYQTAGRAQIEYWESQFVAATAAGAHSLRVVGDVWCLAKGVPREELLEYERGYDELLARRFPLITLCLYDVREFSSLDALRALRGHGDGFRYPVERLLG